MAHELKRFLGSKVDNVPALITQECLEEVVSYLETRDKPHAGISKEDTQRRRMSMTDDLAIIPITGTLTYEETFMGAMCGMTSYQQLLSDVEKGIKAGIKTFIFDADSGGGEAFNMMETAVGIRKRVDDVGGKIITYVDGTCASACLGLAAISDEIIAHPDARTGSVGVVVRLVNNNKAMKDNGYETTYITSAKSKVPFDQEGDFKKGFLEDIQNSVDRLHTKFASHVSEYRKMSLEDVNGTEAKVFDSDAALDIGFIDKIMNHDEFFSYLETIGDEKQMPLNIFKNSSKDKNLDTTQENIDMSTQELGALQEQLEKSLSESSDLKAQLEAKNAEIEGMSAQLQEAMTSLEQLNKKAEDDKLSARKASLSEFLPEAEVEGVFSALASLDESGFNAVLATYKSKAKAEENTEDFNEVGVSGEADADVGVNSGVMSLIKNSKKA